jgi:hypothetical protein
MSLSVHALVRSLAYWAANTGTGDFSWTHLPVVVGVRANCKDPSCFIRLRAPVNQQTVQVRGGGCLHP